MSLTVIDVIWQPHPRFLPHQFVSSVNTPPPHHTQTHTHPHLHPLTLPTSQRTTWCCCSVSVKAVNMVWSKSEVFFLWIISVEPLSLLSRGVSNVCALYDFVNPTPTRASRRWRNSGSVCLSTDCFEPFWPRLGWDCFTPIKGRFYSQFLCLASFFWIVLLWNKDQMSHRNTERTVFILFTSNSNLLTSATVMSL